MEREAERMSKSRLAQVKALIERQILPSDAAAEKRVLSAILAGKHVRIFSVLDCRDFCGEAARVLYIRLRGLYAAKRKGPALDELRKVVMAQAKRLKVDKAAASTDLEGDMAILRDCRRQRAILMASCDLFVWGSRAEWVELARAAIKAIEAIPSIKPEEAKRGDKKS